MSDGSIGRNKSTEKIKFLFLLNNRVSVFTEDAPLSIQSKFASEHFYSPANYKSMFIPSDTKTRKTGVYFTIMDKKYNNFLG